MTLLTVAIFVFTWVLIAARRLRWLPIGRPAGALAGAVLMVVVGAISPRESYAAVDHPTIVLLFAMMLLVGYLDRAGFFATAAATMLKLAGTPRGLLLAVALVPGLLSAFLVNDAVCVFMTPVVVAICLRAGLPFGPYLIALATSANIGSAATLVGNPQNMIIGQLSGLGFGEYLRLVGPAALVGLVVNALLLWRFYAKRLPARLAAPDTTALASSRPRDLTRVAVVTVGILVGFFFDFDLGYTALAGVMLLVLTDRRDPREMLARVDWSVLVFFAALFVVVAAFDRTGLPDQALDAAHHWLSLATADGLAAFSGFVLVGSNVVSNVPLVLLLGPELGRLGDPTLGFALLGFVSTVAGNLTLIGSVANIIVAEMAREHYTLGFREYLRFGFLSTLAVTAVGVPLIVWLA